VFYEKLRSAVSVERYGTPASRVLAKRETPRWPFFWMATLRITLVLRLLDDAGNVIETHERKGELKEW